MGSLDSPGSDPWGPLAAGRGRGRKSWHFHLQPRDVWDGPVERWTGGSGKGMWAAFWAAVTSALLLA